MIATVLIAWLCAALGFVLGATWAGIKRDDQDE
jgi:hypothetical protein